VRYARDGDRVWILPGASGRKTWWRNLCGGAEVGLVLAGHACRGRAAVIGLGLPGFAEGLTAYPRAHARRAAVCGCSGTLRQVPPTPSRSRSNGSTMLVRVDLDD
jgi:hypothetical protein